MQGMPMKMLFTYQEAQTILGYPSYNAVCMAVRRGELMNVKRGRRVFIHRDEVCRVLGVAPAIPLPTAPVTKPVERGVAMFLG
jgi:hypothetical protein